MKEKLIRTSTQERGAQVGEKHEGKRLLHELEATGQFLFHGTSSPGIENVEPRQAHTIIDGQKREDGEPAVCASVYADPAIFRAVIQRGASGFGSTIGPTGVELNLQSVTRSLEACEKSDWMGVCFFTKRFFSKNAS